MAPSMLVVIVLMLVTLVVMALGLGSMLIGGDFSKRYGNRLMVARVTCQALTIGAAALMMLAK